MRVRVLTAILVFASSLSGCLVEPPGINGESNRTTSTASSSRPGRGPGVISNIPAVSIPNGAVLDDRVEIVGTRLDPGKALPGETVRVTNVYRVLEDLDRDYMIFVHAEDADGRSERMNLDHEPQGGNYPTSQWKKGETVQDTFEVLIPTTPGLRSINLWLGFWHRETDTRLPLKNPEKVRNDGKSRILVATIPVGQ